jgi:hypothetical protein
MATSIESVRPGSPDHLLTPTESTRLQRLIDDGAVYVPQALNSTQFVTLRALLNRIASQSAAEQLAARLDAALANRNTVDPIASTSVAFDYQLGLDELDSIAHTRTGFAFADLTPELQDAMLSLVATGDLTTRKLNLPLWLANLQNNAAA